MSRAILGRKVGMTQIFDESGHVVPVTVMEAGPCVVVQKRTAAKHRYTALQIGFSEIPGRKLTKPVRGVFERLELKPQRFLREIRMSAEEVEAYKVGDPILVSIFAAGEFVDVEGTSKGKGFQGVMKRFHFRGSNMTHGTHEYRRHGGAIGCREDPGHIFKGRGMPGHMGDVRVTTQNLKVVKVDAEKNLLLVRGAVPGCKGALVLVHKAVKHMAHQGR
jgi:large subunit ribosomal protein L3